MKHINRFPYFSVALLAAWVLVGAGAIVMTDHALDTPYLAYALLLFTAVLAAANLFRSAALVAVILSLVVYNVVFLILRPLTVDQVLPLVTGNVAILGAGLLGWLASHQITKLQQQLEHANGVIYDLRLKDPVLGVVRLPYAMQTLKTEVMRNQRYQSSLCLILIQIADQEGLKKEQGQAGFQETKRQVCDVLSSLVREMDLLFGEETLGIILPETNGEAAMVVARRITDSVARKVRVGVHIGLAEFGIDAFSDEELYRAADTAVKLAERTDKPIVTYSQVRSVTETEKN